MLTPVPNSQVTRTQSGAEKQKENTSAQNTKAGQVAGQFSGQDIASPLSDFLNAEVMKEIIPDDAPQTEQGESTDALVEITEEMEASATQIDKEELVAELLESVPELIIDEEQLEEQLDAFAPVSTDGNDGGNSAVQNLVEAVVETMADTSVETLVNTFVQTDDIAKLVSSKSIAWSHVGKKLVEKTIMLLNNGMAYTDLTTPPGQLEMPSSLESVAGSAWTSWHQDEETGAIYLGSESTGGKERLVGAEIDTSPLSIEDIAGTHTKVEARSWSSTQETHWSDIVFHEDGVFEYAYTTVSTTGGYDTLWMESMSQSASYVSANRPVIHADGTVEESNGTPNTNMFGSFKLAEDGLSIELTYADGTEESRLIYKNDGYVHFGSSSFTTRHETKDQLARIHERRQALGGGGAYSGRAEWFAILADSMEAANRNREQLNDLFRPPTNSPVRG